jgi:serine/threonine protein kinase
VLKVYDKSALKKAKMIQFGYSESRILFNLHHPFIVKCLKAATCKKHFGFLLEYCPSGDFKKLSKSFSEAHVKFYSACLCHALLYLHKKGIIYHDWKLENILMGADGYPRLADFGLADDKWDDKEIVKDGYLIQGNLLATSPEQLEKKGYSALADWWGLGVVIYEMAYGHSPFDDSNSFQIRERIKSKDIND